MAKLIAILNVLAWSGFWAFGYLALTTDPTAETRMLVAFGLAALGAGMGIWAYLWIIRHTEATGYAKPRHNRVMQNEDGDASGGQA